MKKSIFFVVIFVILNGCAHYSAFVGPVYTMAKTGNIVQAGSSMIASYGIKKTTGQLPTEHVNLFVKKHKKINSFLYKQNETRECFFLRQVFAKLPGNSSWCFRYPFWTN